MTPTHRAAARRRSASTAIVWILGVPLALLITAGITVALMTGDTSIGTIVAPFAAITSLSVGVVLVTRLPYHRIGWLLWIAGIFLATTRIAGGLADHGLTSDPGSIPGAIWFGWLNAWSGIPALFILPIFLPLLYPTGRPLSRRWRPVAIGALGILVAYTVVAALSPFAPGTYPPDISNPFALTGVGANVLSLAKDVLAPTLILVLVLGLISMALRYRRSSGIERQQLKGLAYVGAIAIGALILAGLAESDTTDPIATIDTLAWLVGVGALALMPVVIGLAVLRYRLYEIDRLVSRTISWGVVTVLVGALFVGMILALQAILAPVTGSNELAVAGSTLVAFVLFAPIRRRVQKLVDHRFNRARYDAQHTVAAFASRLSDDVDFEAVRAEIITTIERAVQPASVSLWLRA